MPRRQGPENYFFDAARTGECGRATPHLETFVQCTGLPLTVQETRLPHNVVARYTSGIPSGPIG